MKTVPSNEPDAFAQWLKNVPKLPDGESITLDVPVTLRTSDWFTAAEAAGRHNWTIGDVFSWFLTCWKEGLCEWSNHRLLAND